MTIRNYTTTLALALALGACANNVTELSGPIDITTPEKVAALLAEGHRDFTVNRSAGGNVMAAAVTAGLLNAHDATLVADGECPSACARMLMAVNRRGVGPRGVVTDHEAFDPRVPGPASNLRRVR